MRDMTITEFLEARVSEDEAMARAASGSTVVGEAGAWSPALDGDEWEVGDGGHEVEVLVALRPGLARPPRVMEGYWGAITGWEDLGENDRDDVVPLASHIARHDPSRVLAECAAKRAIIIEHGEMEVASLDRETWGQPFTVCRVCAVGPRQVVSPCPTLKSLAAVYKDHPDYQQEWAL